MNKYPHLMEYYNHYIGTDGRREHEGCFPNLIIWIREALNDDQWEITKWLEMTDEQEEEFGSWGSNSRWAHVVEPMLYQFLIEDEEDLRDWCKGVLVEIAEQYGDPDVEAKYFSNKKDEQ